MLCRRKGTCCTFIGVKKSTEQKLSSHVTLLLDLICVHTKNYQVISNGMGVIACTRFRYQRVLEHNGGSESTLEHHMPTGPYLCLYQILSKHFKPHTHEFGLEIHSGEVTRKQPLQRLSFLRVTRLPVLIYATTKYYQNISNHIHKNLLRNSFSGGN